MGADESTVQEERGFKGRRGQTGPKGAVKVSMGISFSESIPRKS